MWAVLTKEKVVPQSNLLPLGIMRSEGLELCDHLADMAEGLQLRFDHRQASEFFRWREERYVGRLNKRHFEQEKEFGDSDGRFPRRKWAMVRRRRCQQLCQAPRPLVEGAELSAFELLKLQKEKPEWDFHLDIAFYLVGLS